MMAIVLIFGDVILDITLCDNLCGVLRAFMEIMMAFYKEGSFVLPFVDGKATQRSMTYDGIRKPV
jgi:hypothetical protein